MRCTFSTMERIFLSMIVSGLLLAVTSTGLLVFTRGEELTVAAMNLPAASVRDDRLTSPRQEQDRGRHRERTHF